jgi:arylformamidase
MSELIDISLRLTPGLPAWPGGLGYARSITSSFERGDDVNVSAITMDVHCGTHVETALHFIDGGEPLEATPLDAFVGPAQVVDVGEADAVDAKLLDELVDPECERLLIRSRNSERWAAATAFEPDYVALTLDAAAWIAARRMRLVGVDYLSVQRYDDSPETHRVLMRAGVAILEGVDLSRAEAGTYRLTCLPLWLADAEAAPARAILETLR